MVILSVCVCLWTRNAVRLSSNPLTWFNSTYPTTTFNIGAIMIPILLMGKWDKRTPFWKAGLLTNAAAQDTLVNLCFASESKNILRPLWIFPGPINISWANRSFQKWLPSCKGPKRGWGKRQCCQILISLQISFSIEWKGLSHTALLVGFIISN